MRVSEVFSGSKYLKAADLPKPKVFTIQTVVKEEFGEPKETKLVVGFREEQRKLVLNKTNATAISSLYGDYYDRWINQQIELFTAPTTFKDRPVLGIRVGRPTAPIHKPAPQVHPASYQAAAPVPQYATASQRVAAIQPPIQAPNVPFDA